MTLTLDVGCGNHPRGDVNLDYRVGWSPEIEQKVRDIYVDVKSVLNFVLGKNYATKMPSLLALGLPIP